MDENVLNSILQSIMDTLDATQTQVRQLSEQNRVLMDYAELLKQQLDNLPYEWNDSRHRFFYKYPRIESHEETIRRICEEGMSLGRYGDGEFAIMQGVPDMSFSVWMSGSGSA